jgi:hypothetical protein
VLTPSPTRQTPPISPAALAIEAPAASQPPTAPDPQPLALSAALAMPPARLSIAAETDRAPADQSLSAAELRQRCTAAQIRWRNAFGKNRHLSKPEMIAALVG